MKGKKKESVLVDTGVLLKYFLGEKGKDVVGELLNRIISKELKALVSVCTLSELTTVCIRRKKEVLIPTILEFIHQNFIIVDTASEVSVLAGYFKAQYSTAKRTLSYADSVILACAFLYACVLLTYDPEFEGIEEVRIMTPDAFLNEFLSR